MLTRNYVTNVVEVVWLNKVIRIEGLPEAPILKRNAEIEVGPQVLCYLKQVILEITDFLLPYKQHLTFMLVQQNRPGHRDNTFEPRCCFKKRTRRE